MRTGCTNGVWTGATAGCFVSQTGDRDVKNYIKKTGATDKKPIHEWAKGLKELGLWESHRGYMLRSSQNYGTGTTVEGFGALNALSGVLVNGPTWGADWMGFGDTSRYMQITGLSGIPTNMFLFTVAKLGTATSNHTIGLDIGSGTNNAYNFSLVSWGASNAINSGVRTDNAGTYSSWTTGLSSTAGTVGILTSGYGGGVQRMSFNSSHVSRTVATTATISSRMRLNIRADNGTQGGLSDYAFAGIFAVAPTVDLINSLRDLYKNTIGHGLGLP